MEKGSWCPALPICHYAQQGSYIQLWEGGGEIQHENKEIRALK